MIIKIYVDLVSENMETVDVTGIGVETGEGHA